MPSLLKWLPATLFGCVALFTAGAQAATPQILALVETTVPVALHCEGEICQAELSAFCLQREQAPPSHGTPYRQAASGGLEIILTAPSGAIRRLAGEGIIRLASARSFTAVTARLSRRDLSGLAFTSIAIAVGPGVSLLPSGPNVDAGLEGESASKLALGAYRSVGQRVIDRAGPAIEAVRATNALINFVPDAGARARLMSRDALWQVAVAARMPASSRAALAPARHALENCAAIFSGVPGEGLRRCLQISHDSMLEALNRTYWRLVGAGS